jgi:hypothetical protein
LLLLLSSSGGILSIEVIINDPVDIPTGKSDDDIIAAPMNLSCNGSSIKEEAICSDVRTRFAGGFID